MHKASLCSRWLFTKVAFFAVFGALAVLVTGSSAQQETRKEKTEKKPAQEVKKPAEKIKEAGLDEKEAQARPAGAGLRPRIVVAGYTRPGNPPDRLTEKGKIKRVAFEPDYKGLGGTVYFMVLELTNREDDTDPWGTGVSGFTSTFVEGLDYDNTHSPPLDTRARYLYLYQVVNDRGMDPLPIRPAANVEIGEEPVASATLRLRADPRLITSWGYFDGIGFVMDAKDRTLTGEAPAGLAGEKEKIIAVSATPPIIESLPEQMFKFRSPAYSLSKLRMLGKATQNLKGLTAVTDLQKKRIAGIKMASWADNLLQATTHAIRPDEVRITFVRPGFWSRVFSSEIEPGAEGEGGEARPASLPAGDVITAGGLREVVFQANWFQTAAVNNLLKMGQHSVVYGFTSDQPPINEPLALADPAGAVEAGAVAPGAEGIRPVQIGAPGAAPGVAPGFAPGTAPSPTPAAPAAAPAIGGGIGGGVLGGIPPVGGVGGGFPGVGGVGGFGAIPPPIAATGGGGVPAAAGGTPAATTTTTTSPPTTTTTTTTTTPPTVNIPITITNSNLQSQRQAQLQHQRQNQRQAQHQVSHGHHVVPEPGAFLLGLLGLPALLLVYWRRRRTGGLAGA
jgi:hypothetical protein